MLAFPITAARGWRALTTVGLGLALACSDSTGSSLTTAVRFLAVVGELGSDQRLIEYEAPPLSPRRVLPLVRNDTTLTVLLRSGARGGFYALRFPGITLPARGRWELVRFDARWQVTATRSAVELGDSMSMEAVPYLQYTADHQHLIANLHPLAGGNQLLVLDPGTLAPITTVSRSTPPLPPGPPSGAVGSEVLLTWGSGGSPLIWVDVLTGATTDSVTIPNDYAFQGALTKRLIYRRGPQSGAPRTELFDLQSGVPLAALDSAVSLAPPMITHDRLVYFQLSGYAEVVDASSFTELGRALVDTGFGRHIAYAAVTDSATSMVIAASGDPSLCGSCLPPIDAITVVDPQRITTLLHTVVGQPVVLVR